MKVKTVPGLSTRISLLPFLDLPPCCPAPSILLSFCLSLSDSLSLLRTCLALCLCLFPSFSLPNLSLLSQSLSVSPCLILSLRVSHSQQTWGHISLRLVAPAALLIPRAWAGPGSWQSVFTCYYRPFLGETLRLKAPVFLAQGPQLGSSAHQAIRAPRCPSHSARPHRCHQQARTCLCCSPRGRVAAGSGSYSNK